MKPLAMTTIVTVICLGSAVDGQIASSAPADAFLSFTVSPGTLVDSVLHIPGTPRLTASIVDELRNPITEGRLVWEVCSTTGLIIEGRPSADCANQGSVRWRGQAIVDLVNQIPIGPCLSAGQQIGFCLSYTRRGRR